MENISLVVMDLDGTFIYGDYQQKIIELCTMHQLNYGFITGRSYKTCLFPVNIFKQYTPGFLAPGAGTELYLQKAPGIYTKDTGYEQRMARSWPGKKIILEQIAAVPGCEGNRESGKFRISLVVTLPDSLKMIKERLSVFQVKMEISRDCFIDILPANGGREGCLDYLTKYYHCSRSSIITSGDRENDLEILQYPLHGIVVSNCYSRLWEKLKSDENIFFAESAGSRGVYEGLSFYLAH